MSTEARRALPPLERQVIDSGEIIEFAGFLLNPAERSLTRGEVPIRLGGRSLDLLIALVGRAGQVVAKDELVALVWQKAFIEESNLRVHIAALRKALGDGQDGLRLIASVPGRGYSFVGKVRRIAADKTDAGGQKAPPSESGVRLPAPLNRIIGRDGIIAEIAEELPRKRFISITGTGGIGKTAVALAAAERLADNYRHGIRFIDLGPLGSPALIAAHIASLLRLPASDAQPLQEIVAHLRSKQLLILLDNCEHLIDAASEIVEEVLKWTREAHILATSREPLRATGEWVRRLETLAVPADPAAETTAAGSLRYPAVQLFVERLRACDNSFELSDSDAPIVADICARLDGLPLAIELAATRARVLGIRGLADRLDNRFAVLTKGRRTAVPRHQTLGATIDWSYETLREDEKAVWRRLSVFSGAFGLDAALAIGRDAALDDEKVVDLLDGLVEKSLLVADPRGGTVKYRLLESLRIYAFEKLLESGEAERIRRRHAQYFHDRCLGAGDNWIETPTPQWLAAHSGDIADIRAALNWAFSPAGNPVLAVTMTATTAPFWFKLLLLPELRRYLERAVWLAEELPEIDDRLVMRLNVALGHSIFHTLGPVPAVSEALERALALATKADDVNSQLQILWALSGNFSTKGDYPATMDCVERIRRIFLRSQDPLAAPLYDRVAALGFHLLGQHEKALGHAELALAHPSVQRRSRRDGVFFYDHKTSAGSHYARTLWLSGRPDQAAAVVRDTIQDAAAIDQPFAFGYFLVFGACPVSLWAGDWALARRLVSRVLDVASGIAFNVWQMGGRLYELALEFLAEGGDARSAARARLLNETALTPYQAESLSTIDWRLLCRGSLEEALGGTVNWSTAEVLRAQAETLLDGGGLEARREAEALLLRSLDMSRSQKALSWELRAATSLARLWRDEGRPDQARGLLSGVYGRFTEGFATRDLLGAKALLDELAG